MGTAESSKFFNYDGRVRMMENAKESLRTHLTEGSSANSDELEAVAINVIIRCRRLSLCEARALSDASSVRRSHQAFATRARR